MSSTPRFPARQVWSLCAGAGLLLGGLAGCYAPATLPEGSPCESTEQCPDPQLCALGRCWRREPRPDAPVPSDAEVDAPGDAAVDAMPLPCSTAGLSCSGMPTMFTCGGHCWVRCPTAVTRETARAACAGWVGALGEIDNADEQTCVASHLGGALTWIGLLQTTPANTPGTGWTWNATANPMTYTHWVSGQPDDGTSSTAGPETGREQCGLLRPEATWADDPCSNPRSFFCERP